MAETPWTATTPAPGSPAPSEPPVVAAATVTTLTTSLEATPGTVLAWATKPGAKTSEGLASILAVPVTAIVSFVVALLVSWNTVSTTQSVAIISSVVPAITTAAAAYAIRGYAAARALVKAEAIRLHLTP